MEGMANRVRTLRLIEDGCLLDQVIDQLLKDLNLPGGPSIDRLSDPAVGHQFAQEAFPRLHEVQGPHMVAMAPNTIGHVMRGVRDQDWTWGDGLP